MGYVLHKFDFQDALALYYGLASSLYSNSPYMWGSFFCGSCALLSEWGLLSLYQNEIRDLINTLLTEVCSCCALNQMKPVNNPDEFHLSTSNTQEGGRLDIAMNGFWGGRSEMFC